MNYNKIGESVFSSLTHMYVVVSLGVGGVGKRCLSEKSISSKPFSCHFGAGCMWCWSE